MDRISVLWQGKWQEADVLGLFRENEIVARLQESGEEIVVPLQGSGGSPAERIQSLEKLSEIFSLEVLLAQSLDNILEAPLPPVN